MQVIAVYSEAGGVTKTTTSVSLAMSAALSGKRTVLIDLDPRGAATTWLDIEPVEAGLHVGAILGSDEDTAGYAEDLAVESAWNANLRVIPSHRTVSNRESDRADHAEIRLARSLEGLEADVVIIDCPNRQGGPLILAALNAADTVIYAARPNSDGIEGFTGAQTSVQRFVEARQAIGAPVKLHEAGIIVNGVREPIMTRVQRASVKDLADSGLLLYPLVPERVVVEESRRVGDWYGNYTKGELVSARYNELARKVIK